MSRLFKDHTELLAEFSQFLPDGSPDNGGGGAMPQPKGPKGKGVLDRGGGAQMKQHGRPGAKTARQQADEEEEHYWQKRKANRKEDNGKREMSARSPEAEFFSKCRSRMPKPLYLELLKCLNLYSQQIIDRSELLTLVHDLFKRTQIEQLFSNFRRLLGYTGGEMRDAPSPPSSRGPMADGGSFRDQPSSIAAGADRDNFADGEAGQRRARHARVQRIPDAAEQERWSPGGCIGSDDHRDPFGGRGRAEPAAEGGESSAYLSHEAVGLRATSRLVL